MKTEDQEFYINMMKMYEQITAAHERLIKEIHATGDTAELADQLYVISGATKLLDELEKKFRATRDLAERLLCILWVKEGIEEPIRTPYVTASPKVRMAAQIPKKGTEDYEKLMNHMGITGELLETDAVRPHWPGLVDYVTELASSGRPLPPGVDINKTYAVYSVALRSKKGITE